MSCDTPPGKFGCLENGRKAGFQDNNAFSAKVEAWDFKALEHF